MVNSARLIGRFSALVLAVVIAVGLSSCSPNKNNAATRKYQEFITRYNIHYNGDKHYRETLADMETKYEDDYSRRLYMHPIEAKQDESAPQPAGNFDRSIEKAQKAIQVRSIKKKPAKKSGKSRDPKYKEWMKREEYNPFLHNSWLMMGRSQFFNGDFLGAASTFFYISRHFTWLPQVVTESKLMQALAYVALGWQFEAEMILTRIKTDELTTGKLKKLYNYVYADFYLHADDYDQAIPFLVESVKGAKGAQKTRLNFLLGQVYALQGKKQLAYDAFKAAGSSSSVPYRTKFNSRIKQSEVYTGSDIEPEVKALKRMTRYDRNKEYLDQVYYAIGNLYLSRGDTVKAIENYVLANEKSTRSGVDKAVNQISLGNLYFEQRKYELAQPCYSEAVPLLPKTFKDYDMLKRRSDVLDELAVYSGNVTLQDSLLRLSAMSPEERMKVIEKIIADLKKKEKEEAEAAAREEYLANQAAQGGGLQDNNTPNFVINADNSWYFYNTAAKNAGKTEFQKRWGSRKLEDDWRRRNKSTFNTADFDADGDDDESDNSSDESGRNDGAKKEVADTAAAAKSSDPHYPEYYLAQIPETEADKATAHEVIQEGLYNMGVILKDKLEDYGASLAEFNRLLGDYPDNIYRLDAYYNLYLMFMRQGKTIEAEKYRRLILSDFPESKYGVAMRDPNYIDNLRGADSIQAKLYEETYQAYLDNRNAEVHKTYETVNTCYPLSKILPKFMFLHALAYVTENKPEEFNAVLRELLERYPDTDITPTASAWLKGMAQGRKLQAGVSGNVRGMLWDIHLGNDSTANAADVPAQFELNPDSRQLLIFSFPTDRVRSNALLFDIARHNFRAFVVKDFDLEPMNFGRLGMIIVRGFDNMEEINHYRKVMANSEDFKLPAGVRPIVISETDFQTLMSQNRSFEEYFRFREEQNYIDAQADVLAPEEIEELPPTEEEMEETEIMPGQSEEISTEAPADIPQEPMPAEEISKPIETGSHTQTSGEAPSAVEKPVRPSAPAQAEPKPAAKPAQQSPINKPKQQAKAKPVPVVIEPGSEGDDPLFDD